jgi:hypothetical protein
MFGKLWQKIRNFFISGWLAFSKFLCCVLEAFGSSPLSRCYAAARAFYSFRFPFHRTNPNETKIPLYAAFQAAHSGI